MTPSLTPFYRGKRVLVTGHTGFKGGWLCAWLSRMGAEVTGLALPPQPSGIPTSFSAAESDVRSVIGDVRDPAVVGAVLARFRPEIVFHLAAQSLVRRGYREPVATFATNVMGTVHLLEAVRTTPSVRAVVVVTSDKCYENREWEWSYRETDAIGGADPYSSSKGCAELVVASYRRSYFTPEEQPGLASARAGNVIGGGDWSEDRLVPDFVRATLAGRPLVLRHPSAVRPWQHVLEPLHGYMLLARGLWEESQELSEAWNFGPAEESAVTVQHLARSLVRHWGRGEIVAVSDPDGWHEAHQLRLDARKARSRLGWSPLLALDEAVAFTARWYDAALQHGRAGAAETTGRQIDEYERRISHSAAPLDGATVTDLPRLGGAPESTLQPLTRS
jgi:CDP-glucose 4,6-dehydratase